MEGQEPLSASLLSMVEEAAPPGCHHCGAPVGHRSPVATVAGREVRICGDACRTAVETIANAGLDAWYGLRTHSDAQGAATADPRHRAEIDAWRVPEVEASVVRRSAGGGHRGGDGGDTGRETGAHGRSTHRTSTHGTSAHGTSTHGTSTHGTSAVTLTVEGMRCAGCAWLVERLLASVPGVNAATVDFPLRRAEVRFDARVTRLHTLLEALARVGYRAVPYTAHEEEAAIESERRTRIRGLGISALFGMQVMLLSIALYASEHQGGMDAGFERLFRWLAMVLTVPVLIWPGRAFFTGAAAALHGRRPTMDVPVALGLSIAFLGSVFATITGEGDVWFDSVVMFVALLNAARYLELLARRRATAAIRALARSTPLVATRVREGGIEAGGVGTAAERVPAAALRPGDRVRVRPGEVVPADGVIRAGHSAFDESLLTGESDPVSRSAGGRVLAGSVNGSGVVEVEVARTGDATVLGGVLRRAEQAARERPAIARLSDRAAAWFIAGVLVLAAGVAAWWLLHDPARTIPVLVSVLVVTCPCALSLATPAAMTAALGALARAGLVVTGANAVERLARATHCLADKTGTLTEGRFRLRSVSALAGIPESRCLALAAALERYATHPAASAIVAAADAVGGREEAATPSGVSAGAARTHDRKNRGSAPDTGAAVPDAGGFGADTGAAAPDAGGFGADTGAAVPDAGGSAPDTGAAVPDAGGFGADTGAAAPDAGGFGADAGAAAPDPGGPGSDTGSTVAESAGGGPGTRTAGPEATCTGPLVDDASADTGGVTGRIGGVRYAVGNADYVARACALAAHEIHAATACGKTLQSVAGSASSTRTAGSGSPAYADGSDDGGRDGRCGGSRGNGRGSGGAGGDRCGGDDRGATHAFLAREGVLLARFTLADTLHPGARTLVEGLRARGIETTIASGDSTGAVERTARALEVARHLAGLSPEDKLDEAARLTARGERVLMLGDGVNDAPALAGAHVSVAMGRGAAAAAARADAVLIGDDPDGLLAGIDVARRARRIVKQNLAWALGYNLVALPLAAAGAVPPWAAAIGMSLSSLAVAGNALRLGRAPGGRTPRTTS